MIFVIDDKDGIFFDTNRSQFSSIIILNSNGLLSSAIEVDDHLFSKTPIRMEPPLDCRGLFDFVIDDKDGIF